MDNWGTVVQFPARIRHLYLHQSIQAGFVAHPASYSVDSQDAYPGGKVTGNKPDHTLPSNTQVKNDGSYTSTTPYALKACTGTTSPLHKILGDLHKTQSVPLWSILNAPLYPSFFGISTFLNNLFSIISHLCNNLNSRDHFLQSTKINW